MKVYVVTSGEYSDYRVDAIFSTKEKAQEYRDFRKFTDTWKESYRMDVWELDKFHINESINLILINDKVYNFESVKFSIEWMCDEFDEGTDRVIEITKDWVINYLEKEYRYTDTKFDFDDYNFKFEDDMIKFPIYIVKGVMYNPNEEVMKKVVYDSVAKYKAEKEGI